VRASGASGAAEACELRWDQVDFNGAVLHVRRLKNGTPSTHPIQGCGRCGRSCPLRSGKPNRPTEPGLPSVPDRSSPAFPAPPRWCLASTVVYCSISGGVIESQAGGALPPELVGLMCR
jgi:hypothetical protein